MFLTFSCSSSKVAELLTSALTCSISSSVTSESLAISLTTSFSFFAGPLPVKTSVTPVATPPPIPPLRPAFKKRSKLSSVKKFLFSLTNFSAAALDISCTASVAPSCAKPFTPPLARRLYQARATSLGLKPTPVIFFNNEAGNMVSNAVLNVPAASAVASSLPPT